MQVPGVVPRGGSGPCRYLARWVGAGSGPLQVPGTVVGAGDCPGCGSAAGSSDHRVRRAVLAGPPGCSPAVEWFPDPCGRVRRRWDLVGRWDVAGGVGWRSVGRRVGGPAASRPHGPLGGGLGIPGPGWPGRSGRHGANGADDGPHTRPAAANSRGTHNHRHAQPGRSVGRPGRPGWSARPPTAGRAPHPAPVATGPSRPAAGPPTRPSRSGRGLAVGRGRSGRGHVMVPGRWGRGWGGAGQVAGG
jgi:hypothetical protein